MNSPAEACDQEALRLYEARGIFAPPRRTVAGYRVYGADVMGVLRFVQQGQRLGLTLTEIKDIVRLRRSGAVPCAHVRRLLIEKEADLNALLAEVRRILKTWPATKGRAAAVCPTHRDPRRNSMERHSLCPACTACPEVVIDGDRVRIGEDANTATLTKEEWNVLVDLIQSGQLGRV